MGRYVISHRMAGKKGEQTNASREAFQAAVSSIQKVMGQTFAITPEESPRGVGFVDADEASIENIRRQWSDDIIVEPEIKRYPATFNLRTYLRMQEETRAMVPSVGLGATLKVTVRGADSPMAGAKVYLFFQGLSGREGTTSSEEATDPEGNARFVYDPNLWFPTLLAVEPEQGYWPWWHPTPMNGLVLNLPPLPKNGPIGWWQATTGTLRYGQARGAGIRIGVIDTGVGPHPYLDHIQRIGSILQGEFDADGGEDVVGHGSHVSGIIAARPVEGSGEFCGVVPGAEVMMIRVFDEDGGANQGDIAAAIQMLTDDHQVDLINMSLGSPPPSDIERDAILHAAERGVLCIASAGNTFAQPILFPAGYPEVAAVSAIGLLGQYPPGSAPSYCVPTEQDKVAGHFFLANFSSVGPTMTCTAPGVGIISTVPRDENGLVAAPYAAMSGTSMASPLAVACLASVLASDAQYIQEQRGPGRAQYASAVLLQSLVNIGLAPSYVGGGVVQGAPSRGERASEGGAERRGRAEPPGPGEGKRYVMAKKRGAGSVPADWANQLSGMEGVSVTNSTADRAYFRATEDSIPKVRDRFSDKFHIEASAQRTTQKKSSRRKE